MKPNKSILLCGLFLLFIHFSNFLVAQFPGCPNVDAGADQVLTCNQSCVDLTATPFQAGATTSYVVESIPHAPPVPYTQTGGTAVSVNTDDKWSPLINLPFDFCFYGATYNSCKIGSNGAIKFGNYISTTTPNQPYAYPGNCPNNTLKVYGDVFGVLHDINPAISGGSIKWHVIGTAPCRIFVVTFNNLGHFSCTSLRSTHMMVLYETTNVIDVYVNNKATCSTWHSGYAIVGIQKPDASAGIAAPNRNASPSWTTTTPEGWRFKPNGAPIYTVDWLKNGVVIGAGNTIQVCPVGNETYTARATYTKCDGTTIQEFDDVNVSQSPTSPSPILANMVFATCNQANGSITVNGSAGVAPYTYSIDNVTFSTNATFPNLAEGPHTIYIQDANGCTGAQIFNVTTGNPIIFDITNVEQINCFGAANGSVLSAATGGNGALTYQLNNGAGQNSGNYTNLGVNNYTITVTDAQGCSVSDTFSIHQPTEIVLTLGHVQGTLCSAQNGSIESAATGGTGNLTYTLNSGSAQTSGNFANLGAGNYTIEVSDQNGCTKTVSAAVIGQSDMTLTLDSIIQVSCNGQADGEAFFNFTGGTAPFTYNITPGTAQTSSHFTNLSNGTYIIRLTDSQGCFKIDTINITQPEPLVVSISPDVTICSGESTLINTSLTGGNGNNTYTWSSNQTTDSFSVNPIVTTTYTVTVTDQKGCTATQATKVTVITTPIAAFTADPTEAYIGTTINFTNQSWYAAFYDWEFGNGEYIQNTTSLSATSPYNTPGEYTVILTAKTGNCIDTAHVKIIIHPIPDPIIYVPNVFTPNGDNSNDTWAIDVQFAKTVYVMIFNRWGNVVAELTDATQRWDGTSGKQNVSDGVYFYKYTILDLKDQHHTGQGFITIER